MSGLEAKLKDILSHALSSTIQALQETPAKEMEESFLNICRTCVLLDKVNWIATYFRDVIVDPFVQKVVHARAY